MEKICPCHIKIPPARRPKITTAPSNFQFVLEEALNKNINFPHLASRQAFNFPSSLPASNYWLLLF